MKALISWVSSALILLVLFMLVLAVVGCASIGLYQMSDEWCQLHPEASKDRCAGR